MDKTKFWIISGAFGGLLFAINLSLGSGLTYATGIPGLSGLITGFTTSFVFYILYRLTEKFGAISIAFTIYAILAIPTVLLGAPGVYKVAIGLLSGLTLDIALYYSNFKFKGFVLGFFLMVCVMIPATYYSYVYLALPNLEKFQEAIFILAAVFIFEGWIAGYLTRKFFNNRLIKTTSVKRISLVDFDNQSK